jgi:hypothetical protein
MERAWINEMVLVLETTDSIEHHRWWWEPDLIEFLEQLDLSKYIRTNIFSTNNEDYDHHETIELKKRLDFKNKYKIN